MPAATAPISHGAAAPAPIFGVRWDDAGLTIVDQRRLPNELVEWRLATVADVVEAIRTLAVRGAPAIGICAAYGVVVGLRERRPGTLDEARATVETLEQELRAVRPTAVNLGGALARVRRAAIASGAVTPGELETAALREATAIHDEDRRASAAIGEHGVELLAGRRRLLTHCNTGRLATGGDGTALAVIYRLAAAGAAPQVLATESRPLLQGARLTAWELGAAGVDVRLIVDSAAGAAMASGLVEAVIVGCDRVAANGDTANKIGTYQLAVLARHHGIPFYVAGPLSSFDAATPDGSAIVVEERDGTEVRGFGGRPTAPPDVAVWNPAFDVTPGALITAFITEVGVLEPPFPASIAAAFARAAAGSNGVAR